MLRKRVSYRHLPWISGRDAHTLRDVGCGKRRVAIAAPVLTAIAECQIKDGSCGVWRRPLQEAYRLCASTRAGRRNIHSKCLTGYCQLVIVRRFRMCAESVAAQVRRRSGQLSRLCSFAIHWKGSIPQGSCRQGMAWPVRLRRIILAIVPATPSSRQLQLSQPGSKDGLCGTEQRYGANSNFQLQWFLVCMTETGEARDARPPSTVVRLI
jgi:hypothetical protein